MDRARVVPRAVFPDYEDPEQQEDGTVRVAGRIPAEYNNELKATARELGYTAEKFVGMLLVEARPVFENIQRQAKVRRLKQLLQQELGDDWLEILDASRSMPQLMPYADDLRPSF